ncbi:helix-turn-helix domain-containing protein [Streptomyces cyaneofuscatus]|uniref:helix-turn-helix domain-containing protein n=1 Tax=Streptomyces cyaneofuscatus TaxID=66883 RepID=UPI00386BF022
MAVPDELPLRFGRLDLVVVQTHRPGTHLLLDGLRPAQVATAVGFHDQAHLNRHFTRHVGTTPGRYRRNLTAPPAQPPPPTVVV